MANRPRKFKPASPPPAPRGAEQGGWFRSVSSPRYVDNSVRSFLLSLAARNPEPAGGAALAVAGASAAALVSLACHTAHRDPETAAADPIATCHEQSGELLQRIQELVDEDVRAYEGVRKALSQRRDGDRSQQSRYAQDLDKALREAVDVPLALAEACLEVLELARQTAPVVKPPVAGDLVAAVHLAEAAIQGSIRNARINASSFEDKAARRDALDRADRLQERFREERDRTAAVLATHARDYREDV